jgi:N-acetylglucosamine kinase-like BadF-type ATPase
MSRPLVLAIDGGQTSTKALIADTRGVILGRGTGSPCDHINGPHGYERNRAAIHSASLAAVADAGIDPADIVAAGMGLTSAPPELRVQPLFEAMLRKIADPEHIWINHDVAANLAGASAGEPGVVVIAGGGSIGYGVDANGNEAKAGGMGFLMGDEGSAWWIGLHAVRAAAEAVDGRGEATELLPFVLEHFNLPTIRHIVGIIYAPDFTRDRIAGISPDVVRIATTDAVAHDIVTSAGRKLAGLAIAVSRQLFTRETAVDIYPTGGVFSAGELVMAPFRTAVDEAWPDAKIREPQFSPEYGALFQAYRLMGVEKTPELLANLRG